MIVHDHDLQSVNTSSCFQDNSRFFPQEFSSTFEYDVGSVQDIKPTGSSGMCLPASSSVCSSSKSQYSSTDPSSFAVDDLHHSAYSSLKRPFPESNASNTWPPENRRDICCKTQPGMMTMYPYQGCEAPSMGSVESNIRKNTTRESTNILKTWLQEHNKNPYPSKGEKIMLAILTKMTLTQVSTWFANARRRLKKENKMTWMPKNRSNEFTSQLNEHSSIEDMHYMGNSSCCGVTSHAIGQSRMNFDGRQFSSYPKECYRSQKNGVETDSVYNYASQCSSKLDPSHPHNTASQSKPFCDKAGPFSSFSHNQNQNSFCKEDKTNCLYNISSSSLGYQTKDFPYRRFSQDWTPRMKKPRYSSSSYESAPCALACDRSSSIDSTPSELLYNHHSNSMPSATSSASPLQDRLSHPLPSVPGSISQESYSKYYQPTNFYETASYNQETNTSNSQFISGQENYYAAKQTDLNSNSGSPLFSNNSLASENYQVKSSPFQASYTSDSVVPSNGSYTTVQLNVGAYNVSATSTVAFSSVNSPQVEATDYFESERRSQTGFYKTAFDTVSALEPRICNPAQLPARTIGMTELSVN